MADYAAETVNVIIDGVPTSGLKGSVKLPDYVNDLVSHNVGTGGVAVRVIASDRRMEGSIPVMMHAPDFTRIYQLADRQSRGLSPDVPMLFEIPGAGFILSGKGSFKKPVSPELPGFGDASEDAPVAEFMISMPSCKVELTGAVL